MKFYINENLKDKSSGKIKFLKHLSETLQDMGVKYDSKNPDVLLHIGRDYKNYMNKSKLICRLDGLHINSKDNYKKNNDKIKKAVNESSAIIYQNEFCKASYETFFPKFAIKKNTCILNGAKINKKNDKDGSYIANVKWRPHKRPKETAESFLLALEMGLDSVLYFTGEVEEKYKIKHKNIKYLGWVQDEKLHNMLDSCSYGIHIAWLDWCPNTVVEYMCNHIPVVCTDSGGTKFIVKNNGIVAKDYNWDYKPHALYNPPQVNTHDVARCIMDVRNINEVDNTHVDILNVAKYYYNFFIEVCDGK